MEFLPIYGLAYSSVKMADSDRAHGLLAAIFANLQKNLLKTNTASPEEQNITEARSDAD